MSFRRFRRKVRCVLKHGPRGCPHIERHTRRPKKPAAAPVAGPARMPAAPMSLPPLGKHSRD